MNRAFFPVVKSLLVAVLALSSVAYAADEPKAAPAKADPAKGEALYTNGDAARNITACVSCHGAAGASTITSNPKLGGQHAAYIHKQLTNFQGADRNNPIMSPLAKLLTDDEMKNIAAYLDAQPAKPGAAKDKDTVELGKKIYRAGIAEKSVPACAGCHSPNGAGIPNQFPRIGGQHQDYTVTELTNFRSGVRKNGPMMATISKRMSDDEIKAVADYIAGLK
ncbi:cytochrome c family protein [Collimonas arenae]|uniref:Cytochrome c family protein n=1 Tax=Collimonas arenae TaxID=279058 RepID=A0A127PKI9_9BURK|nr:c-type cytochrome [Collimonas arenae]AMO98298.1 cytochrome c family protein [Collimonas arenae]AMP08173.1 cytochrome c family protein [Collimonas arenae]